MKRTVLFTVLLALCLLLQTPLVAVAYDRYAVVSNANPKDKLFLRPEPSANTTPLGLYYNGTPVDVLDIPSNSDWAKVRVGVLEGYMMKKHLALDDDAFRVQSAMPIVTVQNVSADSWLHLREYPTQDAASLASYRNGTEVQVLGVDPVWYHVSVDGHIGFMMASYLSDVEKSQKVGAQMNVSGVLFEKRIDIGGGMSPATFTLFGRADENLIETAQIQSSDGFLQQIPIYLQGDASEGYSIAFEDVNFDGCLDFLVCRSFGAYNAYYDYYIWNSMTCLYEKSAAFGSLEAAPVFDAAARQIRCSAKDGAAQYYEYIYDLPQSNNPRMIEKKDIQYTESGNMHVILWQLVNNELVVVREWDE